jgi:hypothetical protein
MSDREHAAMDGVQQTAREAVIDRARPDADLEQLRARHHPVLTRRQCRDRRLDRSRLRSSL